MEKFSKSRVCSTQTGDSPIGEAGPRAGLEHGSRDFWGGEKLENLSKSRALSTQAEDLVIGLAGPRAGLEHGSRGFWGGEKLEKFSKSRVEHADLGTLGFVAKRFPVNSWFCVRVCK